MHDDVPVTYINRNGMKVRINVSDVKPTDVLWEDPKPQEQQPKQEPQDKPKRRR